MCVHESGGGCYRGGRHPQGQQRKQVCEGGRVVRCLLGCCVCA